MKRRFIAPAVLALAVVLAAPCWASLASSAGSAAPGSSPTAAKSPAVRLTEFTAPGTITLNGAGANSIAPFFEKVFYGYTQLHPQVTVNYSPAGSSVGIKDIQENTVDFGDSEIPMSASAQAAAKGGAVLQVPVELGGVAISYNVPGLGSGLHLDGPTLAAIFDGTITKWNDPAIAKVSGSRRTFPILPSSRSTEPTRPGLAGTSTII